MSTYFFWQFMPPLSGDLFMLTLFCYAVKSFFTVLGLLPIVPLPAATAGSAAAWLADLGLSPIFSLFFTVKQAFSKQLP